MKHVEFKSFNSKLLLFGEYTVINRGRSLALPIQNFQGRLRKEKLSTDQNLQDFLQYLQNLGFEFNERIPQANVWDHLVFESNIPVGYGAGSSGAVTAAVYDAYFNNDFKELNGLQMTLAKMENYFHGQSSGLDPLVIYLNKPLVVSSKGIELIQDNHKIKQSLQHFFLIDTGISRSTGPLVELYKSKIKEEEFIKSAVTPLKNANEKAIDATLSYNTQDISNATKEISEIQFEFFQEMIPGSFFDLWEEVLENDDMSLKLCGAGGGGFLLFFAEDPQDGMNFLDGKEIEFLDIIP